MKYRVSFDLDLSQINPEDMSEEAVRSIVLQHLINPARKVHKDALQTIRRDPGMDAEHKTEKMSERVRAMLTTLMCQANMDVERLPDDHPISNELPFEAKPTPA